MVDADWSSNGGALGSAVQADELPLVIQGVAIEGLGGPNTHGWDEGREQLLLNYRETVQMLEVGQGASAENVDTMPLK